MNCTHCFREVDYDMDPKGGDVPSASCRAPLDRPKLGSANGLYEGPVSVSRKPMKRSERHILESSSMLPKHKRHLHGPAQLSQIVSSGRVGE